MKRVNARTHTPSQPVDPRALAEIDDLIDNGAFEAASVLAWDVQRATPGDPVIWLLLTRIDFLRERYAAAMYAARMASRLDPSSTEAWVWLARTGATRARWRTEARSHPYTVGGRQVDVEHDGEWIEIGEVGDAG